MNVYSMFIQYVYLQLPVDYCSMNYVILVDVHSSTSLLQTQGVQKIPVCFEAPYLSIAGVGSKWEYDNEANLLNNQVAWKLKKSFNS